MAQARPVIERIRSKVSIDPDSGCWEWAGAVQNQGYGVMTVGSKVDGSKRLKLAHRLSYELHVGPIPDGLSLDHLCRNTKCVNPAHLEPVTHAENVRRGNAGKPQLARTHCPQGHPYSGANLYTNPDGRRECRTCRREANARYRTSTKLSA